MMKQGIFILLTTLCLLTITRPAAAQPAILDVSMTPPQATWALEPQFTNQEVRFALRVQRQGNLSRFGTFDYFYRIQVQRPGGVEVWNRRYGFDEQGYAEQRFNFPGFFLDRSISRAAPSFGSWKVRLSLEKKDHKSTALVREYLLEFRDGKGASVPAVAKIGTGKGYPVPAFGYGKWKLQDWGVGVFDELPASPGTFGTQFNVLASRKKFSVSEVISAWNQGHRFGAWVTGPALSGARDSNNRPLYLFGYILHHPKGKADGLNPKHRQSVYANSSGSVVFPLDLRQPGVYRLICFIRERGSNASKESSWIKIGTLAFTLID